MSTKSSYQIRFIYALDLVKYALLVTCGLTFVIRGMCLYKMYPAFPMLYIFLVKKKNAVYASSLNIQIVLPGYFLLYILD